MRTHETSYRDELDAEAAIDVRFFTRRGDVVDYAVVLLVEERDAWHAVRVMTTFTRCMTCTDTIGQARSRRLRRFIEAPRAKLCRARSGRFGAATAR